MVKMVGWLGHFTNQCRDPSCYNVIVCSNHNSNPLKCIFRTQYVPSTPNDACVSQAKLSSDPYHFSFVNPVAYIRQRVIFIHKKINPMVLITPSVHFWGMLFPLWIFPI